MFRPGKLHGFKRETTRESGFPQPFAIIRYAVGGLVSPAKQQDRFLGAHFSTR